MTGNRNSLLSIPVSPRRPIPARTPLLFFALSVLSLFHATEKPNDDASQSISQLAYFTTTDSNSPINAVINTTTSHHFFGWTLCVEKLERPHSSEVLVLAYIVLPCCPFPYPSGVYSTRAIPHRIPQGM
mmetsp:Transcript_2570/g.4545  ORF Transcript_2570/g.4545 Transcript_2570/m.4545 type:complete len:129 (+) Transcript_2570:1485-1871(+)